MTSRPSNTLSGGEPAAAALPLWFVEGMAEYLSVGSLDPNHGDVAPGLRSTREIAET